MSTEPSTRTYSLRVSEFFATFAIAFVLPLAAALPLAAQETSPADPAPAVETPAPDTSKTDEAQPTTLEELIKLVKEQQKQIEKQNELIEAQQKKIEELNALVQAVQAQVEDETGKTVELALEERIKQLESSVEKLPDIPTDTRSRSAARPA